MTKTLAASRVYYGWWIVVGCMLNMIITSGICNIAFPVFLVPWTDDFGWSRTAAAGGISMLLLALGISAPFAGRLAMRYGPRRIMLPATVLAGFCLWACAWMTALWQLYVIRLLAGVAFAGMAHVPVNILMSRWFSNLRGRATGLALIGAPIGGLLFTPIVSILVQNYGWRSALMLLGSLVWLVLLPLQFLVIKDDPQSPLTSDITQASEQSVASGLSIEEILRASRFWILLLVLFFNFTGIFSMMVHQLPHFIDSGRTPNEAAFLVSIMMGCSVFGGASFGWVSDRYNVYQLFAMCAAFMTTGVIALLADLPYFYLALFGVGFGGSTPLMAMAAGRAFGMRAFGEIYGYFQMTICLSGFAGPTLMGLAYDLSGDYALGFKTLITGWVACAIVLLALSRSSSQ